MPIPLVASKIGSTCHAKFVVGFEGSVSLTSIELSNLYIAFVKKSTVISSLCHCVLSTPSTQ